MHESTSIKMSILLKKLKEREEVIKELREELDQYEESRLQKFVSFKAMNNLLQYISIYIKL